MSCIMASTKNVLVAALLVWAFGATLLALTFSRRPPQCANTTKEQLREVYTAQDEREELSLVPGLVQHPGRNETDNINTKFPESSRQDQLEVSDTSQVLSTVMYKVPKHLQRYALEIFQPKVDVDIEEFTMVMLTYKRVKMLSQLIKHYCGTKHLHKILVIWNDVGTAIPQYILDLTNSCQTRLEFIQEKENKLTNRFKPRPEIETECKF